MTKEKIDTVLERLDRLGLGVDNGDGVNGQESTQNGALLMSVISALFLQSSAGSSLVP